MTVDRKRLRELALMATPGPWKAVESLHGAEYKVARIGSDDSYTTGDMLAADGRFIAAANPQTILELLDALEAQPDDARIPREPTEGMMIAGLGECELDLETEMESLPRRIWRSMFNAAIAERTKEQG